jgi:hypothetical protein
MKPVEKAATRVGPREVAAVGEEEETFRFLSVCELACISAICVHNRESFSLSIRPRMLININLTYPFLCAFNKNIKIAPALLFSLFLLPMFAMRRAIFLPVNESARAAHDETYEQRE